MSTISIGWNSGLKLLRGLKVKTLKVKNYRNIHGRKKIGGDELDNTYNGGEAFARGGFGCLFKPALKCQNKENPPNYVSKLSLKNDSEREYNYISSIKKRLESLPENIKSYLSIRNEYFKEKQNENSIKQIDKKEKKEEKKKQFDSFKFLR